MIICLSGRISKKERLRKRNQRLRKILQPKNAPMVLNELIGCVQYSINESPPANFNAADDFSFKATVTVDEKEHVGFGKSKALAKSNAAEAAVKHLVLKKLSMGSNPISKNSSIASNASDAGEEDEKMEITTEDDDGGFSWSHVASFALHKLFNSWEDPNNKVRISLYKFVYYIQVYSVPLIYESMATVEVLPTSQCHPFVVRWCGTDYNT